MAAKQLAVAERQEAALVQAAVKQTRHCWPQPKLEAILQAEQPTPLALHPLQEASQVSPKLR